MPCFGEPRFGASSLARFAGAVARPDPRENAGPWENIRAGRCPVFPTHAAHHGQPAVPFVSGLIDFSDNLTWAFNGNGTHTWQINQAVYRALKEASDEAIDLGFHAGTKEYKDMVRGALQELAEKFMNGRGLY